MAETLSESGKLTAAQQDVRLAVAGMGGVAIQVQGTFTGTISFEATVQGQAFEAFRVTPSDSSTATDDTTTTGLWTGSVVGYSVIRARMSAYTNGAAVVFIKAILPSPGGSGGGGGTGSDVNLIEVGGESIALGQTTMADSLPVVIASDQSAIPVTGSFTSTSVGPTGDPVPADADSIGFQEPGGDLETFKLESFDYDSGAGTQAQTAIGLVIPASGGPVPVGTANPLPVSQATAASLNATVVGTGTFAVQTTAQVPGTAATNLGKAEDAGHTSGDTGVAVWGVRVDSPDTALSNTNLDYSVIATSSTGALRNAPPAEDFAALANGPSVKKYYANTGAVTDGIVWSPAAGKRWYVTDIMFTVSSAATVTFEDDDSGGDVIVLAGDFAANSGLAHSFATPLFSGQDAADLIVTTSAGNIKITVTGYEI